MAETARFTYSSVIDPTGARLLRPILSVGLVYETRQVRAEALIDSGADANILPHQLGLELGLTWSDARPVPQLSGNLGQTEARAVALSLSVPSFDPVWMVFIWVQTDTVRLLLGQINFFQEFHICFYGSANYFDVQSK